MKPLLVTSGEPAGIGPDLCISLAQLAFPVVVLGDKMMLVARAKQLGQTVIFHDYSPEREVSSEPQHLTVLSLPTIVSPQPGVLNPLNAPYVLEMLNMAAKRCLLGEFAALITAPVHKAVLNQAGFAFTGHTEFFAKFCQIDPVVMMLACPLMKVALMTTHLPLRNVADAINIPLVKAIIRQLNRSLQCQFHISFPKIFVAGLNPHAGEGGYLGREEIDIIIPALAQLSQEGIDVHGPYPADTLFSEKNIANCDAFVAMYHDQGLAVLKYASFGHAVNVTLGLPFIRVSVDHGTALDLAGTNQIDTGSLKAAVELAASMAKPI